MSAPPVSAQKSSAPVLLVGGDEDYPPYEFLEGNEPRGFNVDLIRAVADAAGLNTEVSLGPWQAVRRQIEEGQLDVLAGMAFSRERQRRVDFSAPHSALSFGLFVPSGSGVQSLRDLTNAAVLVQAGGRMRDSVRAAQMGGRVVTVATAAEALRLLAAGRYDAALLDRMQGLYFIRRLALKGIRAVDEPILVSRYCFAVPQGREELLYRLNEGLQTVRASGQYDRIYDRWFGALERSPLQETLNRLRYALAVMLAVLLCVAVWLASLRRQVHVRTAALRKELAERRRTEEALRANEERYRALFDLSPSGIVLEDSSGRILDVNPAACRALRYGREELVGSDVKRLNPRENWPQVDEHIRRILGGETLSHEVYNLRRDGADCYMRLQEKKILLPDGTEGILVTCSDVTDQRLAEQALRESEEKYRRLFELENDAVLLTDEKTGRILETNPAAEKLYGYTRAELLAMRSADLSAEAEPADETERKRADPAPVRRHVRKDGARIPVEISASHYDWRGRKVRLATVRDVSERLRAQEEIEKQRRFLRGVIDSDPALIYVKDREGRVVLANDTFAKTFGLDQERIIGRTVFEIVPDHTVAQAMHDDDQRVLRGEVERIEREEPYVNARSEPRWAYTIRAPILGPDGKPEQLIGVSLDITVRKGEENERRKMEAQVQHTQKLESLGVLSGGIAHDFNNLLVGVLGNADLALDELPAGSVARDMLLDIRKSAQRAAELCRQLLAYSGRGKFVVERISLNAIIREMTHLLDISISKKVKTRFDLAEDLPAIEGDATQIRQVVMNLITNASEAVGDEVGTVAVRTGAEDCAEGDLANAWLDDRLPSGRYAYLEIADSGCGMDEETKRRIFDPFFTTKFMGRGLGLAAVLGIVRGHHGAIRVDSMPGRGSVFRVLFPAIEGSVEAKPDLFSGGLSEWRGHGTVLLVDDEEPVRHVGERLLTRIGFRVLTARDGVEALDLFRQHMNELKCVLVDLTMPRMDGAELFRAICGIRTDIPVVLLSGYSEQEAVKRFDGLGLAGFIQKPFEVADLLDLLRKALGGSGQAAGGTPAT